MNHNRVLVFLRSQSATLSVLALALVAQMPHAADVFRLIVHGENGWATLHSYTFAVALELAVLLFVVQNKQAESYGFAAVSVAMNLSYYYLHGVQLFNLASIPALLVSVSLPAAIARYSHAVVASTSSAAEHPPEQPPLQKVKRTVRTVRTDEQSAEYTVRQPVQIPEQVESIAEQVDWSVATAEQKRAFVAELLNSGAPINKTELVRQLSIGRTTLYGWIRELQTA